MDQAKTVKSASGLELPDKVRGICTRFPEVSEKITEPPDWNEIKELIREGYLRTAPKLLVKQVPEG